MKVAVISTLEAIYLIYMFMFFKTKSRDPSPVWEGSDGPYFVPMYQTNVPVCRICKFGKYASVIGVVYLIMRAILHNVKGVDKKYMCRANRVLVWGSFMLAMAMSTNAALYLLPIVIVESLVTVEFLCKCF